MKLKEKEALMTYLLYQFEVVAGTELNGRFDPSSVGIIQDILYSILNDLDSSLDGLVELETYKNNLSKK